jgi:hypothetical protein
MTKIFVTPCGNTRVISDRHKDGFLPQAGDYVPDTPFWQKRIAGGECQIATPPAPKSKVEDKINGKS